LKEPIEKSCQAATPRLENCDALTGVMETATLFTAILFTLFKILVSEN